METSLFSTLAELGTTGLVLGLLYMERRRSSSIQESRIDDLKQRIAYLEAMLPPTLLRYADTPSN